MQLKLFIIIQTFLILSCGRTHEPTTEAPTFGFSLNDTSYWQSAEGPIVNDSSSRGDYIVGAGLYDITGPVQGLTMNGYVRLEQKTAGIETRLWSRAFYIEDPASEKSTVIVTADICHIYQAVKQKIVEKLQSRFGNRFDHHNVLITATHTHSGPGAFSHYKLYNLATFGFSPQNFDTIVDGIVESVVLAYENKKPAHIKINNGMVENANINRSIDAYRLNPSDERAAYPENVNRMMTVLSFNAVDGEKIGMLNYFGVHATSVEGDNKLISGDNKGYASYIVEKIHKRNYLEPKGYVAAFANSEAGDSSPNIEGDLDGDRDWDCAANSNFECAKDSGMRHVSAAIELDADQTSPYLSGPIDYRQKNIDFSNTSIRPEFADQQTDVKTCYSAIGLSMLAGAPEDGPGVGEEGRTCESLGRFMSGLMCDHPQDTCHGPKPIAIATGLKTPTPWTPQILPIQIVRIGQLALAAVPAEFTTMSGRRVRSAVYQALQNSGVEQVVLAGYANSYAGYVTTPEEYAIQYYEGASTHFGPNTLRAYQQGFFDLASHMAQGQNVHETVAQPILDGDQRILDLTAGVDRSPIGSNFGDVSTDVNARYNRGQVVKATFIGSNPNRMPAMKSHYIVERQNGSRWDAVAYDWDLSTRAHWEERAVLDLNYAHFEWHTDTSLSPGRYRIRFVGRAKTRLHGEFAYEGKSSVFELR
jgi:neutral ceramidase